LANLHTHSYWLDFENDVVRCSGIGCTHTMSPSTALTSQCPDMRLEIADMVEKGKHSKVYLLVYKGSYLGVIKGYTRGVLHLSEFKIANIFDMFREVVQQCFGVNLVQLQKEVVYDHRG
jgi:hypothetical protein